METLGYSNDQDFYQHLKQRYNAVKNLDVAKRNESIFNLRKSIEDAKAKRANNKKKELQKLKYFQQQAINLSRKNNNDNKQRERLHAISKIQKAYRNKQQRKLLPDYRFDVSNRGNLKRYKIKNMNDTKNRCYSKDVNEFIMNNWSRIKSMIRESIGKGIKSYIGCNLWLVKKKELSEELANHNGQAFYEQYIDTGYANQLVLDILNGIKYSFYARGKWDKIFASSNISDFVSEQAEQITSIIDSMVSGSTDFVIFKIESLYINVVQGNNAISASSYIELPEFIKVRKACINVVNKDDKCSMWSIKCAKFHQQLTQPSRVKQLQKVDDSTDYSMLEFPTKITGWEKYEQVNNEAINIYGLDDKKIFPLKVSSNLKAKTHINLLLIGDKMENNHYVPIISMSKLLSGNRDSGHQLIHCPYCLQAWRVKTSYHKYEEHMSMGCQGHEPCKTVFPNASKDEDFLSYKGTRNEVWCPYVAYLDFEAFTTKLNTVEPSTDKSFTSMYQKHKSSGYTYAIVDDKGKVFKERRFTLDKGVVNHMVKNLLNDCDDIIKKIKVNIDMDISPEEQVLFDNADKCYMCNKQFIEGDKKVRDHDHSTGKYRGACHNKCNLNFNLKNFKLPVFVHNLKGYDSHLILSELNNPDKYNIDCIAQNSEKYMSFNIGKVAFKDSYNFLSDPLDALASNMDFDDFKITRKYFPNDDDAKLMTRKGVFPYDWWDGADKFDITEFPPIEEFYSKLYEERISAEDYERGKEVFNKYCKNMKDYHDLYLRTDVYILADVFEKFRRTSHATYGIDPVWYISLPSYTWDCGMKFTDVELQLLTDPNMYLFIERGIRGGVSMINHRYAKANNKYMQDYDDNKESSFITYLDANNLYGWAMSQSLPTGDFKWEFLPELIEEEWIMGIKSDSERGYIFEVDLEYPEELHDTHNDYPVAVENIKINKEELSDYQKKLLNFVPSTCGNVEKLVGTLKNKENYVIHYRNLQLYLSLGLKLKKINRCLSFEQSDWLKPYIELNTKLRTESTNKFEKDFYKLMNNAVFGKTMENVRNRINYKLIYDDKEKEQKWISRFNFADIKNFNETLTGIMMRKVQVKLNKPIYAGFAILDLSKYHMIDFHYNYMMKKYGQDNAKLLFTDTDSLCYHVKTDDMYMDMYENKEFFDFSDYPEDSQFYNKDNKKVIGKFKDETSFDPIKEFVGLKAKMYSFITSDNVEKKVAKGIKTYVIKKGLNFDGYKKTLFGEDGSYYSRNTMNTIRSKNHQLSTIKINKIGLCAFDDKRYILDDGFTTLAYGNKNIVS